MDGIVSIPDPSDATPTMGIDVAFATAVERERIVSPYKHSVSFRFPEQRTILPMELSA